MEQYGVVSLEFLTLLVENRTTEAKRLIGYVEKELGTLPYNLKPEQQQVVKEINGIIECLEGGYDGIAIKRAKTTLVKFNEHGLNKLIKNYVGIGTRRVYDQSSGRGDSYIEISGKDRLWLGAVTRRKRGLTLASYEVPEILLKTQEKKIESDISTVQLEPDIEDENAETERPQVKPKRPPTEKMKFAKLDTPEQIADKFSAMYHNEWREAFQSLRRKEIIEKASVTLLLAITEEAYSFCQQEAERQLKELHLAFQDILEFGTFRSTSREKPQDTSLLVQYRNGLAINAIPKLQNSFFESKLKPLLVEKLGVLPDKNGVMNKYANKAVELTWWMCVHDPPVYMCPTTKEGFEPKMYTEYSKKGTKPEFFARPGLRTNETGPLLLQGVVQYR